MLVGGKSAVNRYAFLHPHVPYWGHGGPEAILFNANLQEFSHQVGYISGLHQGGKISSQEAHDRINQLWQALEHSWSKLNVGR